MILTGIFSKRLLIRFCGVVAGLGLTVSALSLPREEPENLGLSSSRLALLDTMLRQHVEDGRIPGLVAAVARDGHVAYLEPMGWQSIEDGQAMRADSIFQIRSMSKPITAVAVMQLIEQDLMRLSDPVSAYIPAFADIQVLAEPGAGRQGGEGRLRPPHREMTIEDLLLHQSGLSHRFSPLYSSRDVRSRDESLEQLVQKVASLPLIADPGKEWNYSIATTVLGRVVELVSGQGFDRYLREQVFTPLQMHDTGFHVPEDKQARLARIYQVPEQTGNVLERVPEMPVPITEEPPLLEGAAGLVSTVPDYLRFLQAMLNGGELDGQRILREDSVLALTGNRLEPSLLPLRLGANELPGLGWGYGFSVVMEPARVAYGVNKGEFGWNGSLGTFSWADPQTGTIAVLMMQIEPSGAYSLSAKFKSLVHQSLIE